MPTPAFSLLFDYREGEYEDAVRPDLILPDLGMPRVDGEDVLQEIEHHPDLRDIPVVILAGVNAEYIESQDLDHDADEDAVIEDIGAAFGFHPAGGDMLFMK